MSRWIISPLADTLLFIAVPLVTVAALIPLSRFFPPAEFAAVLLAFFTFGHHLPGFLRAYGDKELFSQYRWRFLLAPPLVFTASLWFAWRDLHGLLFAVFTWDIWHVLMQHYGFLRIYDAKSGGAGAWSARLDRAVSLSWYITFIAISPHYLHNLLLRAYSSGVPVVRVEWVNLASSVLLVMSVAASVAYAAFQLFAWRRGAACNGRKLATLACFLAATYYLYVVHPDFQVGFAVWSAFHCVQYYGIVWAFNQKRISKKGAVLAFLRFLFQPRLPFMLLYLGVIAAYGAINYTTRFLSEGAALQLVMAFVVMSGTLHYYYDGFIWKIRQPGTGQALAIDTGTSAPPRRLAPGWLQTAYLAAAIAGLAALEWIFPPDAVRTRQELVRVTPQVEMAHVELGKTLRAQGRMEEAAAAMAEARLQVPHSADVRQQYGLALAVLGREDQAAAVFEQALAIDSGSRAAHYNLAVLLAKRGESRRALDHFRRAFPEGDRQALRALEKEPGAADALNNLALGLLQSGDHAGAVSMWRRAVELQPRHAVAHLNLASALMLAGDRAAAAGHYRAALTHGDEATRASAERMLRSLGN
jgi:tetratricopeptide (TPR) repeat protein